MEDTNVEEKVEAPADLGEEKVEKVEEKVETKEEVKEPDYGNLEPEVRKRPIDYIEQRQARRAERPAEDNRVEEDDEELTPKAKAALQRELEPYKKVLIESANNAEISQFLTKPGNDKYQKYSPLVKKYMDKVGMSAEDAFILVDAKYGNPAERGASEERERQKKSTQAKSGGTTYRPSNVKRELTPEDIAKLDPKQFQALQSRLAGGENIQT